MEELEAEKLAREEEKVRYLGEKLPPLQLSNLNMDDLQVRFMHKTSEACLVGWKDESLVCSTQTVLIFDVFRRNSAERCMHRLIRWMRSGTTVSPKSSRTAEMYDLTAQHQASDLTETR